MLYIYIYSYIPPSLSLASAKVSCQWANKLKLNTCFMISIIFSKKVKQVPDSFVFKLFFDDFYHLY